jgi:transposase
MPHGPIEILGARERRRRWSAEQKLRMVAETEEAGASVAAVAARHDVVPSLLHTWRRQVRRGQLMADQSVRLLPVHLTEATPLGTEAHPPPGNGTVGSIEITLPDGSRVRVGDDVSLRALRRVMTVLRG